jgi:aryl-alcohol dehydrogenase-like predicted oxidoreductase
MQCSRRHAEAEVIPACEQLGVGFLPWSHLGQGFLTGAVDRNQSFDKSDVRSRFARFAPDAMRANMALVEGLKSVAEAIPRAAIGPSRSATVRDVGSWPRRL